MDEPATKTVAPAAAQGPAVCSSIPPSTSSAGPSPDQRAEPLELAERAGQELLAAPARVDGHAQDQVDLSQQLEHGLHRCTRAERDARLAAGIAHRRERVVGVRRRLDVDRDPVGAGLRERRHVALRTLDHQMDVHVGARVMHLAGERLDHLRAHAERGHEVAVHDVDVDRPRAGCEHGADLIAEAREVGRQDRGRDARGRGCHQIGWSIELRQWLHA